MLSVLRCHAVRVVPACAIVALLVVPAAAQDTGTISGIVVDNQDQVVPGATVTLTNERTQGGRTTRPPRIIPLSFRLDF